MPRNEKGISPFFAEVLLLFMVLLSAAVIANFALEHLENPIPPPLESSILVRQHFKAEDTLAIIHAGGPPLINAFRADRVCRAPEGDLYENLKWINLELRVNGVVADNRLVEYAFFVPGGSPHGPENMAAISAILLAFRENRLKLHDEIELIYRPTGYLIFRGKAVERSPETPPVPSRILMRLIRMGAWEQELKEKVNQKQWSEARSFAEGMLRYLRDEIEPLVERYMRGDPTKLGTIPEVGDAKRLYIVSVAPSLIDMLRVEDHIRELIGARDPSFFPTIPRLAEASRLVRENIMRYLENVENIIAWKPGNRPTRYRVLTSMEDVGTFMAGMVELVPIKNVWRDVYYLTAYPTIENIVRIGDNILDVSVRLFNFGTVPFTVVSDRGEVWIDRGTGAENWWVLKHFRRIVVGGENRLFVDFENRLLVKRELPRDAWAHMVNETVPFRIGDPVPGYSIPEDNFPHVHRYRLKVPYVKEAGTGAFLLGSVDNGFKYRRLVPGDNIVVTLRVTPLAEPASGVENLLALFQWDLYCEGGPPAYPMEKQTKRMIFWQVYVFRAVVRTVPC